MNKLILVLTATALFLPAGALGKGPTAATMDGPGSGRIAFGGDEGSGPLGDLTQQSGFFPAVFGQQPDPMLDSRPSGDLGPKYTVTYSVPGPNNDVFTIRQDVYPYAEPSPVTYVEPGQKIFDMETRGGWFGAGPELKDTLVAAGLPAEAPTGSSDSWSVPTVAASLAAVAALLLIGASAVFLRRRARPAPVG